MSNEVNSANEKTLEVIKSLEHSNHALVLEVRETEAEKADLTAEVSRLKAELESEREGLLDAQNQLRELEERLSVAQDLTPQEPSEVESASKLLESAVAVSEEHIAEAREEAAEIIRQAEVRRDELFSNIKELEAHQGFVVNKLKEVENLLSSEIQRLEAEATPEYSQSLSNGFEQGSLDLSGGDLGDEDLVSSFSLQLDSPHKNPVAIEGEPLSLNDDNENSGDVGYMIEDFSDIGFTGVELDEIDEIIETINDQRG